MPDIKATMVFQRSDGKNSTISVADADPALTQGEINTAMNLILAKNVFAPETYDLTKKISGKLISTTTQDFVMSV